MFEFLVSLVERLATAESATALPPTDYETDNNLVGEIVELERAKAMIEAQLMWVTADLANRADGWVDFSGAPVGARIGGDALAAGELAPALHLSPVTAYMRVDRAVRMTCCLPLTLAAMAAGDLDLGRVLAIYDAVQPLSAEHATAVEQLVLPKAVNQTCGELRAALRRAIIAVDPDGAEERRKVAVKGRRVRRYQREDGMSALEAVLSAIDTGEIYDVIDEVAKRTKIAGDTRSFDARRADALVRLVLGRDPQLGPEDPEPPPPPSNPDDLGDDSTDDGPGAPATSPDGDPEPVEPEDLDERFPPEPADDRHDEVTPATGKPRDPSDTAHPSAGEPLPDEPSYAESTAVEPSVDQCTACDHDEDDCGAGESDKSGAEEPVFAEPPAGTTNGDEPAAHGHDGDEAGWSQWPDAQESELRDGDLNELDRARDARTARISELAALALSGMTCRRPGKLRWVALNSVRWNGTTVMVGELEGYGPITGEAAHHLLASGAARPPDRPTGREPTLEQTERHDPPDWLDREIRARDGTCRSPGCRQSAYRADNDHTIAFPRGKTVRTNLGALCRRHHRMKQVGTWHVVQDDNARYTWTSTITGRRYVTDPRGTTGEWRGATTQCE